MLDSLSRLLRRPAPASAAPGDFVAFIADVPQAYRFRAEDEVYSPLASARLRMLIPARQLARHVDVWLVPFSQYAADPALTELGRPHAVVVSKLSSGEAIARRQELLQVLAALGRQAQAGERLFADLSDDFASLAQANDARFLKEYQQGLGRACAWIVPTQALAAAVKRHAHRGVHVIEDPFELSGAKPVRTWRGGPLRLAWFGTLSRVSVEFIEGELRELGAAFSGSGIVVEMVAQAQAHDALSGIGSRISRAYPSLSVAFTPWSLPATEAAIERCDFVWLPQDVRSGWGRVKSHNRLVAAIRGGRLAIASPIPAYEELAPYAWVGDPLAQGLRWAMANPDEAARRVTLGQPYVEQRFSPEAVGRRWAQVLGVAQRQ